MSDEEIVVVPVVAEKKESTAFQTFLEVGETQRRLFYRNFLSNNRVGEIVCVNGFDDEDSFLFERFEVANIGFIACFRLLSEDSLISEGVHHTYRPVAEFVELMSDVMKKKHEHLLKKVKDEGTTIEKLKQQLESEGRDPSILDCVEFTRDKLEEELTPGRKRVSGDRSTEIQLLQRQLEIPNDLQRPRLNRYIIPLPDEVFLLMVCKTPEEEEQWKKDYLVSTPTGMELGCHLPLLRGRIEVEPTIYSFPERELDVEREMGL